MKRFKDTLNISDIVARLICLWGPPWLLYGLPPLIAFLLYLPALHGGLVWDDPLYLYHPLYRHPPNWSRILTTPFVLSPNYFRPLVVVTFVLGGAVPWLQHLVNLLLHVLNTVLVTLLAARLNGRRLGESVWPALVAPLLYAVHPALVEGVAFISGRFDLMLTTFLLLALLADLALRDRPRLASPAVGLCVFLAALCKEMAAGFLLVLPLWHLATGGTPASFRNLIRRQWSVYLAVLLAMAACLGLRYAALGYLYLPGAGNPVPVGSPLQHALLAARSLAEYVLLAVWPFTTLSPIHYSPLPLPLDRLSTWLAPAFSLAILVGVGLWLRRDRRSGALAAASLVALLPVLNLLPLELGGGAFVAERFLLFPLALLTLAISQLPTSSLAASPAPIARFPFYASRFAPGALALWIVGAVATVQWTVPHWRSEETLWEWGLRRAPQSATPYTNLALVAVQQGDPARGLALAEAALQRDPEEDTAHNHRGLALFHLGRYEEAEAAFARAAELAPDNALYWSNRAGALRELGQLQEAERLLLDEALPRDPDLWVTHFNLGLVYLRADRPDLAAQALNNALALAPPPDQGAVQAALDQTRDPARWLRLSDLLLAHGEAERALQALDQAGALGAAGVDVAVGRSAALIALGRLDEAEALLRAALLSAPQDARLYNNLGLVARERGDLDAARDLFERAVQLAPEWDLPRQNLEGLGH